MLITYDALKDEIRYMVWCVSSANTKKLYDIYTMLYEKLKYTSDDSILLKQ